MKKRKGLIGEVISNKMEKTVVVEIQRTVHHPMYGKVIRQQTRFKAHDEKKECHVGDKVRLVECRPLSKEKHWKVVEVLVHTRMVMPVLDEGLASGLAQAVPGAAAGSGGTCLPAGRSEERTPHGPPQIKDPS